ncbi:unnamed protein product [Arabidopsis thaliana]|jgi:hypothetical protein|uniref:Uncharacterized protein n=1 Tax=Arabidopsis thaliana TaxID=3702 RepID=A0A5S9XXY1_ARATH|nr:unnamed protein product [Arabidopsis thaliana]VYS63882.1 unnamed protein product [Arabidopsis thaliana]
MINHSGSKYYEDLAEGNENQIRRRKGEFFITLESPILSDEHISKGKTYQQKTKTSNPMGNSNQNPESFNQVDSLDLHESQRSENWRNPVDKEIIKLYSSILLGNKYTKADDQCRQNYKSICSQYLYLSQRLGTSSNVDKRRLE